MTCVSAGHGAAAVKGRGGGASSGGDSGAAGVQAASCARVSGAADARRHIVSVVSVLGPSHTRDVYRAFADDLSQVEDTDGAIARCQ